MLQGPSPGSEDARGDEAYDQEEEAMRKDSLIVSVCERNVGGYGVQIKKWQKRSDYSVMRAGYRGGSASKRSGSGDRIAECVSLFVCEQVGAVDVM